MLRGRGCGSGWWQLVVLYEAVVQLWCVVTGGRSVVGHASTSRDASRQAGRRISAGQRPIQAPPPPQPPSPLPAGW